jgi:hypothetical protein
MSVSLRGGHSTDGPRHGAMHYFIDESGIFANPGGKEHAISSIVALAIPSAGYRRVARQYRELRRDWPPAAEHKGRALNEPQVAAALRLLASAGCIVWARLIDMGVCSEEQARRAKRLQAAGVLCDFHRLQHHTLQAHVMGDAKTILRMSTQQFIQHLATLNLVDQAFRESLIHLGMYQPTELGRLRWTFDERRMSALENRPFIEHMVCGHMQSSAAREPLAFVRQGDYSAFQRFQKSEPVPPEYLREHVRHLGGRFYYTDLGDVFRNNLRFADSATCTGLQLADICASAVARAARGTLQQDGWEPLGPLLLRYRPDTVRVVEIAPADRSRSVPVIHTAPYADVLTRLHKMARPILKR